MFLLTALFTNIYNITEYLCILFSLVKLFVFDLYFYVNFLS